MDISKQLHAYEVEYHVLQDEMVDAAPLSDESDRLDKLEKTNAQLKKQNMDLLEKLQVWPCFFFFSFHVHIEYVFQYSLFCVII